MSREQALDCWRSDDLIGIGMDADAVRRWLHPEGVVGYVIDCAIGCAELAHCEPVYAQIAETIARGGSGVSLRVVEGEANGRSDQLAWLEALLAGARGRFAGIRIGGLDAARVTKIAAGAGVGVRETLERLRDAGLESLGGAGAPLAGAAALEDWLAVHRVAHQVGLSSSAHMVFGDGETLEQRVAYLDAVRTLQEETGGFTAIVPFASEAAERVLDRPTAVEYLKTLAVCRLVAENIANVQANWQTQGLKVLQMGLRFGANDVGSVGMKGSVATEEELRRVIRDAGFMPVERDGLYRTMFLN